MKKQITWEWLEERLQLINARALEKWCNMYRGKLNDVKRGKVKLTSAELDTLTEAMGEFKV